MIRSTYVKGLYVRPAHLMIGDRVAIEIPPEVKDPRNTRAKGDVGIIIDVVKMPNVFTRLVYMIEFEDGTKSMWNSGRLRLYEKV